MQSITKIQHNIMTGRSLTPVLTSWQALTQMEMSDRSGDKSVAVSFQSLFAA
jgi:hypothetical protein